MRTLKFVTYGAGGFDPTKQNVVKNGQRIPGPKADGRGNIVDEREIQVEDDLPSQGAR